MAELPGKPTPQLKMTFRAEEPGVVAVEFSEPVQRLILSPRQLIGMCHAALGKALMLAEGKIDSRIVMPH